MSFKSVVNLNWGQNAPMDQKLSPARFESPAQRCWLLLSKASSAHTLGPSSCPVVLNVTMCVIRCMAPKEHKVERHCYDLVMLGLCARLLAPAPNTQPHASFHCTQCIVSTSSLLRAHQCIQVVRFTDKQQISDLLACDASKLARAFAVLPSFLPSAEQYNTLDMK